MLSTTALLLSSAALFFMGMPAPSSASPVVSGPFHAYCEVLWLFGLPCDVITAKLTQQIEAFSPVNMCAECQYMLISSSPMIINANHTSPDGVEVEILSFTLSPTVAPGGCRVSGESRSLSFTSLLDTGTNYCNLYNLLLASGLISAPGFLEMTNEWACLGYSLAPCKDAWLEKMLQ